MVIIAIITWIFWNFDRHKGFILTFTLIISLISNNILKIVFRSPRPFQVLNQLQGKRIHTATGYSFPSGHTQGATTFYSSLFLIFRKRILLIVSILLILSVALSRVYLAVHWPIDVIASILLGIIIPVITVPFLVHIENDDQRKLKFIVILNICTVLILLILQLSKIFIFGGNLLTDDLIKITALLNGVSWGFLLDMNHSNFSIDNSLLKRIIRYIIGLSIAFLIMEGMKVVLPYRSLFHYIRYFITGIWIIYIYPYLGSKIGLFSKLY